MSRERYYHGTRTDLRPGDLIEPGYHSNYNRRTRASHVYMTATIDTAIWGAALAVGDGPGRIYIVEPLGPIEDDPNPRYNELPGNPTKSYRSRDPLRVTGEVTPGDVPSAAALHALEDRLEHLKQRGI